VTENSATNAINPLRNMEHPVRNSGHQKREKRGELRQFLLGAVNCGLLH